ncbi:MAG: SMC-Scp complex subunit ScpB [Gammaproteobacteria bacterium]|nr:SMC-Scp complex subunit ScpB [Gammaproteobacteria bacterium]
MSEHHIRNVIEAALLAGGKPLQAADIAQLFDEDGRPEKAQIVEGLRQLEAEYADRGIELKETASGWRVQIRSGYGREVGRLWPERAQKYSRALLETLALIAYRQPITRAEIESVRGVAVNPNIVKTLMERDWVRVVGHRDVPGHPELLGTTREFLDYFGLRSIDELPPLAELKAMTDINPQLALPSLVDESSVLVPVAEGGAESPAAATAPASDAVPEGLPGPGDETVYV